MQVIIISDRKAKLTIWAYLLWLALFMVPNAWQDALRIFGSPHCNVAFIFVLIAFIPVMFGALMKDWLTTGALIFGVWLAIWGGINRFWDDWLLRSYMLDVGYVLCGPMGFACSFMLRREHLRTLVIRAYIISAAGLALSIVALRLGWVPSYTGEERLVDLSEFTAALVICILNPLVLVLKPKRGLILIGATWGIMIVFCIDSATRSALIVFVASVVVSALAITRRARSVAGAVILIVGVMGFMMLRKGLLEDLLWRSDSLLATRLVSTDLSDDARYEELSSLLGQLKANVIWGRGLGITFDTTILIENDLHLKSAFPHIGYAGILLKGGVIYMLAIFACAFAAARRGWRTVGEGRAASLGGLLILLYWCFGGYGYQALFLFGVCVGWALKNNEIQSTFNADRSAFAASDSIASRRSGGRPRRLPVRFHSLLDRVTDMRIRDCLRKAGGRTALAS